MNSSRKSFFSIKKGKFRDPKAPEAINKEIAQYFDELL